MFYKKQNSSVTLEALRDAKQAYGTTTAEEPIEAPAPPVLTSSATKSSKKEKRASKALRDREAADLERERDLVHHHKEHAHAHAHAPREDRPVLKKQPSTSFNQDLLSLREAQVIAKDQLKRESPRRASTSFAELKAQAALDVAVGHTPEKQAEMIAKLRGLLHDSPDYKQYLQGQLDEQPTLLRFLRATNMNADKAYNTLVNHWKWWRDNQPDKISEAWLTSSPWFTNGIGVFGGRDKQRRPSLIVSAALYNAHENAAQIYVIMTTLLWVLESTIKKMQSDVEQFVVLLDLTGSSLTKNFDASLMETLDILELHYPGRLGQIIAINPSILWNITYRSVQAKYNMVPKSYKAQVVEVKNTVAGQLRLQQYFDRSELPIEYGGTLDCLSAQQKALLQRHDKKDAHPAPAPSLGSNVKQSLERSLLTRSSPVLVHSAKESLIKKSRGQSASVGLINSGRPPSLVHSIRESADDIDEAAANTPSAPPKPNALGKSASGPISSKPKKNKARKDHEHELKDRREKDKEPDDKGEKEQHKDKEKDKEKAKDSIRESDGEKKPSLYSTMPAQHRVYNSQANYSLADSPSMIIQSRARTKYHWEVEYKEIQFENVLGSGGMGTVYKGKWRGSTVAIKKTKASEDILYEDLKGFLHEIDIMSKLRHPNILLLLGACLEYPNICIICEYISEGNVHEYLIKYHPVPWRTKLSMALDAAKGMNFLHLSSPPVLHQDLKSFNLLVDQFGRVKVCDFGISSLEENFADTSKTPSKNQNFGTLNWVAPELFDCEPPSTKTDVYAFGMVLYEFLVEKVPFLSLSETAIVFAVMEGQRPSIPETAEPTFSALMQDCWNSEASKRPDFSEIVSRLDAIYAEQPPAPSPAPAPKVAHGDNTTEAGESVFKKLKQQLFADVAEIGIDAEGKILRFDVGAQKLLGHESDAVIGKSLALLLPDVNREQYLDALLTEKNARLAGHLVSIVLLRKDGSNIELEMLFAADKSTYAMVLRPKLPQLSLCD